MKKWSGGTLIVVLSFVLVVSYTYFSIQPPKHVKQSTYDFFRNHPSNDAKSPQISSIVKSSRANGTVEVKLKEKPRLIDVEGLNDLYSFVNTSKVDIRSLSTWPHLRAVLLRSDGLPETRKGVKEASVAWGELLSILKMDKTSNSGSDGGNVSSSSEIKCPSSVSTFDQPVNSSRELLELPCGLVEDSSVTVIGIPNGKNRRFQIEFHGAWFRHERKPAIILHYNVYIPEENSTKNPVIVQNTWTSEAGWGKEEKCPGGRSTKYVEGEFYYKFNHKLIFGYCFHVLYGIMLTIFILCNPL